MSSVVQNLLDGIVGEGARSTKFECYINFSNSKLISSERDVYALVKTSQFPGKSHDVIELKYKGRTIPIKGQVKYDNTWTCTFYLTQDHELKQSFENWIEALDQQHNIKSVDSTVLSTQKTHNSILGDGYDTTMRIAQLDFNGNSETMIYELHHCFPKSVSAVDVDYSEVGTITEFTVEFSYAYYDTQIVNSTSTNITESLKSEFISAAQSLADGVKSQVASAFNNLSGKAISSSAINSGSVNTKTSKDNMVTKENW